MAESPRVFISYAHSDAHRPAVLALADRLRADGVEAWIDQYEQAPPAGWRAWMEEQLRRADFVLIVASELYRRRAESTGPLDAGRGARYESMLVLDALYEAGAWNVKFVPVVLLEQDKEAVPAPLRSYQRYSLYHDGGYTRLLRLLTGQPEIVAPPLGEVKPLPPRSRPGGSKPSGRRGEQDDAVRGDVGSGPETKGPGDSGDDFFALSADDEAAEWSGAFEVEAGAAVDELAVDALPPEDHPNPFDPWTPAVPPRFQGRASELRRLERALDTGFGVSLVGDGHIGKSSLLRTFQGRLAEAGRTVRYFDGEGAEGQSVAAFVAKAVRLPVSQVPEDADGAINALARWVDQQQGDRPVLLVDGFDGLPERFEPRFFERLGHLIGRLVLVVASRQEVDRIFGDRTSPFDNRLMLVRVGLPKEADARAVIAQGAGLLEETDPAELRRWAGRHVHYLQLYARHLLDARAHGEEDEALDRFLDEAGGRLRELWRHLNAKEQDHLRAVAEGQDPRPPRSLIRRGVLEKDGRPFGEVLETWLSEEL